MKKPIDIVKSKMNTAPVNVAAIFRSLGVEVQENAELPDNISGQLAKVGDRFIAASSKDEHPFRQRFTLAHELGHYVLHRSLIGEGLDDNKMYRSTSDGKFYNTNIKARHEQQANSFAAKVLMPKHLLRKMLDDAKSTGNPLNIRDICSKFEVSRSAAKWRLVNLGWESEVLGIE